MTSILQPLDRMINCPFKKYIKNKYKDFLLFDNKDKENISESRKRLLMDISGIWLNNSNEYNYISRDCIIKAFKITGISNKLDGSEDEIFDGYNIINELSEKKEDNSNEDSGYVTDKDKKIKN